MSKRAVVGSLWFAGLGLAAAARLPDSHWRLIAAGLALAFSGVALWWPRHAWAEVAVLPWLGLAALSHPETDVWRFVALCAGASLWIAGYVLHRNVLLDGQSAPVQAYALVRILGVALLAGALAATLMAASPLVAQSMGPRWGASLDARSLEWRTATAALVLALFGALTFLHLAVRNRAEQNS